MVTKDSDINNEIRGIKWKYASENLDDDLHTDILFLSTSVGSIKEITGVSYNHGLLIYEGHNGRFYYPDKEAQEINRYLIHKLVHDLSWGESLNKNIIIKSVELENVWLPYHNIRDFSSFQTKKIIDLYNQQFAKHCELYQYAWVPEIFQDSEYGIDNYIAGFVKQYDSSFTINNILSLLPENLNHTVYYKHDLGIFKIIEIILSEKDLRDLFSKPLKYIRTSLPYKINDKIRKLIRRYGYLGYHGYDERRPYDFNYYLQLLKNYLEHPNELESLRKRVNTTATSISLWGLLSNDEKRLMSIYHNWGVTKARRRLSQLKNFYYLDKLIEEIAYRCQIPEDFIRFMTPDEINAIFTSGKLPNGIEKRSTSCCCYLNGTDVSIINGIKGSDLILSKKNNKLSSNPVVLHGNIACRGHSVGKAFLIDRRSDITLINPEDSQILVAREADPDIFCVFDKIRAIVTDQGGVTCHIASLAREYGIPCVVGTQEATSVISQGDTVEVDASEGVVKIFKNKKK